MYEKYRKQKAENCKGKKGKESAFIKMCDVG